MSDTPPREGSRLGPYLLGRRLPDADPDLGHVHEAHHAETGAPALVLVPEAAHPWTPRAACTVRSRAEVSPPFLAVEVERTPGATSQGLHALTLMHIQLSGALASVEDRQDTAAFLAGGARPTPAVVRPGRRTRTLSLTVLGVLALGLGWLLLGPHVSVPLDHEGQGPVARGEYSGPISWHARLTLPVIGFPLPSKPLKGQSKPPCSGFAEEEINGGCWVPLEHRAPCAESYAEYQGKCYMPVKEPTPEPRSVEP